MSGVVAYWPSDIRRQEKCSETNDLYGWRKICSAATTAVGIRRCSVVNLLSPLPPTPDGYEHSWPVRSMTWKKSFYKFFSGIRQCNGYSITALSKSMQIFLFCLWKLRNKWRSIFSKTSQNCSYCSTTKYLFYDAYFWSFLLAFSWHVWGIQGDIFQKLFSDLASCARTALP